MIAHSYCIDRHEDSFVFEFIIERVFLNQKRSQKSEHNFNFLLKHSKFIDCVGTDICEKTLIAKKDVAKWHFSYILFCEVDEALKIKILKFFKILPRIF